MALQGCLVSICLTGCQGHQAGDGGQAAQPNRNGGHEHRHKHPAGLPPSQGPESQHPEATRSAGRRCQVYGRVSFLGFTTFPLLLNLLNSSVCVCLAVLSAKSVADLCPL